MCSMWQELYVLASYKEKHAESCWVQYITLCYVWWEIYLHEPAIKTNTDSYLGEPGNYERIDDTGTCVARIHPQETNTEHFWKEFTLSVKLGKIKILVHCVARNSYPWTTKREKNRIKILEIIHITVVFVAKDLSPGSTHIYTWNILLEKFHITVFSVARQWCLGESTLLLSVWRGIILPDHLNRHTKNHAGENLNLDLDVKRWIANNLKGKKLEKN